MKDMDLDLLVIIVVENVQGGCTGPLMILDSVRWYSSPRYSKVAKGDTIALGSPQCARICQIAHEYMFAGSENTLN